MGLGHIAPPFEGIHWAFALSVSKREDGLLSGMRILSSSLACITLERVPVLDGRRCINLRQCLGISFSIRYDTGITSTRTGVVCRCVFALFPYCYSWDCLAFDM
jgi:hypothetical protein